MAIVSSTLLSTILRTVWEDLGELSVRLRSQSIIGLSVVVVFEMIGSVPAISGDRLLSEAFGLMSTIALLPFEIAIYRLLILDEAAAGYRFEISTVRFQRMLGWTVALWALANIPIYLPDAVVPSEGAATVSSIALIIIGVAVMVRLSILLPAIAVDAPGASVATILADTRGHTWFIVKAYLAIVAPFVLIVLSAALLAWLAGASDILGRSGRVNPAASAFFGALGFLVVTAFMIVSARLFMSLGNRVKGGAQSPGE
ncbi:hypothetical protein KMZ93_05290 [Bradyrhizobium sediminis]|uniref:Uncharacterized protein n=1 Tax=Bradyrhizobium sediminis TaxID=2840469 RepID=A0A975RY03_9BRAD|nr:hypothetical protein [Bradyrhizobium sediminis]QWG24330.1 hypothetical protein KMZ93_05290 [Bradyrhizobium sediminis]